MDPRTLSDRLKIASPCPVKWSEMEGNDRVRRCAQCRLNVYNVRMMTSRDVEALLQAGGRTCVQVLRRRDGTVITGDCRAKWKRRRAWARRQLARTGVNVFGSAGFLVLILFSTAVLFGDNIRGMFGAAGGALPGPPGAPASLFGDAAQPQATFMPDSPETQSYSAR